MHNIMKAKSAQTAIEYILLLTMVAVIVLIAFRSLLPRVGSSTNQYFRKVSSGIMGEAPPGFIPVSNPSIPDPLVEDPPVEDPPAEDPPAEDPPAEDPWDPWAGWIL